ncbi:hypothetical protein EPN81_00105 [Patescibacteria group bacterium]|nr:MAG: hypothetical protein EPN81_00105 [Patescibacteria group bacterium]
MSNNTTIWDKLAIYSDDFIEDPQRRLISLSDNQEKSRGKFVLDSLTWYLAAFLDQDDSMTIDLKKIAKLDSKEIYTVWISVTSLVISQILIQKYLSTAEVEQVLEKLFTSQGEQVKKIVLNNTYEPIDARMGAFVGLWGALGIYADESFVERAFALLSTVLLSAGREKGIKPENQSYW